MFQPGDHGSTYSGTAIATAAVSAVIDEMRGSTRPRSLADRAADRRRPTRRCPASSTCVGADCCSAVELAEGIDAKAVYTDLLDRGLVVNAVTPTTLRLAPPITVTDAEIDEAVGMIAASLAANWNRLVTRHLLDVTDLTAHEVRESSTWPSSPIDSLGRPLAGQGAALIFEKPSNRTRHSMEMAVVQLGGHPVYTRGEEVGFDIRETVEDVARIMDGYHALLAARVFDHRPSQRMAAVVDVPVVNMLSDRSHPLQALADVLTMQQCLGDAGRPHRRLRRRLQQRRPLAGRGLGMLGMHVRFGCPHGYDAPLDELERFGLLGAARSSSRPVRPRPSRVPTRCTPTRGCRWARRPRSSNASNSSRGTRSTPT